MSLQLERKYKINSFLGKEFKVEDYFDESDIINRIDYIFRILEKFEGLPNESDEKFLERNYDRMLNHLLAELEIELKDADQEVFVDWVCNIYG